MAGRIGYNGSDKWKIKATELLNEGGGGGTDDYNDLENKPSINNVELSGNKTAAQLGMYTKSEVDTSLANKMDLNATNGSISNLNILGNYGIGNVENGGRVYITGWQNKYRGFNFPEIAIGTYDAENDTFSSDISMNTYGLMISDLEFDFFGNHGQGSVQTLDVHIDDSQFLIKEGIGDANIIEVAKTGNIDVNASHVVFDSDDWVSAYAVDGFSFACDDDFEIDAVGIKIASDGITNGRALYVDSNGYLVSSAVTDTELGYLSGVTSAIQTQLDGKQASITGGATTIVSSNLTASRALISNSSGKVAVSAVTSTELGYLDGVTSDIQTQLNGKVATTDTIAIAHGGTGATTRLNALKALTNENVGTNATYFLTITDSWGKGGYTSVANVKTVLGLGSAAYETADTAATANTVVKRTADKYVYASYFNTSTTSYNPASYTSYPAFISSDGFLRRSNTTNFKNFLGVGSSKTDTRTFSSFSASSSISFTSGSYFKIGNVMYVTVSVKFTAAVNIGNNATATIASFPSGGLGDVRSVGWNSGQGLLAGLTTAGALTIRVIGQNVPVNATASFQFVMPCSN